MTDSLIERLLSTRSDHPRTLQEAADEIERLTAELKLYRTGEAYTLAAAEIGRLRAALASMFTKDHGVMPGGVMCRAIAREALKDD